MPSSPCARAAGRCGPRGRPRCARWRRARSPRGVRPASGAGWPWRGARRRRRRARRGGEAVRRELARGEGGVAVAAQVVHRRQVALRAGAAASAVAASPPARATRARPRRARPPAPCSARSAASAAVRRASSSSSGHSSSAWRPASAASRKAWTRPSPPRRAGAPRGRGRSSRAPSQCGRHARWARRRLERVRQRAVQLAAPQPRHLGVERRRAPARGGRPRRPRPVLAHEAALEQLREPVPARQRGDEVEVEDLAGDGGGLGGGARPVGQVRRADQHRVAHRLGDRDLARAGELEPAAPGLSGPLTLQRGGELLDEERVALRRVVHGRARAPARRARPSRRSSSSADSSGASGQSASSSSRPARRSSCRRRRSAMVARKAVGAIGGDQDEDRELGERLASADSSSSVAWSDQCRSSRTTRTGRSAAMCASARARPRRGSRGRSRPRPSPSSGRISARCADSGPPPSSPSGSVRRWHAQGGRHSGPYGGLPLWLAGAASAPARRRRCARPRSRAGSCRRRPRR